MSSSTVLRRWRTELGEAGRTGVEAKSKEREELCSQEPWNPTTRPHMRLGAEGSRVVERCPACPGLFVHRVQEDSHRIEVSCSRCKVPNKPGPHMGLCPNKPPPKHFKVSVGYIAESSKSSERELMKS